MDTRFYDSDSEYRLRKDWSEITVVFWVLTPLKSPEKPILNCDTSGTVSAWNVRSRTLPWSHIFVQLVCCVSVVI